MAAFSPSDPARAGEAILFDYLLRLGDDALVLGQRLGEWTGHAPSVEVDLSLANIALDLIGQATWFLDRAGEVESRSRNGDRLAFHRDVLDFRNCLLVEQPNGDFAQTIARQLLYSTWQHLLLQRLTASGDQFLAEFAAKAVKEVAYHRELASEWTIRLGDGTEESARRMAEGLDWCWRFIPELFEVETLEALIGRGIAPDPRSFEDEYRSAVAAVLNEAQLEAPAEQRPILGGRHGHHSEHLGHLLAVMQFLPRTYPDAKW
jgi:ring-1,2-phenylacetyl-CoA epoxidase subunit PaaC